MPFTPGRYTGRAGSASSGRVRRALDGAVDSQKRYGDGLEIDPKTGQLTLKLSADSPLKMSKRGLELDSSMLGDKNRDAMRHITDLSGSDATSVKVNEILAELRRTKRLKGQGS